MSKKKTSKKARLYQLIIVVTIIALTSHAFSIRKIAADPLSNPILFTLVVPPIASSGSFGHQLETFGNHLTGMDAAPRGGDLCMMSTDGTIRFLTAEAGFGVGSGAIQGVDGIAVRQPSVHWNGSKALFSMVIGGPTQAFDQSYRSNRWQIYEITNLTEVVSGMAPIIQKIANQPAYNNVSPIYGSDGQIIFTSDVPLFGMEHTYPQFDEYESSQTNTGIFKLNPSTGKVVHLTHSPSGDFDIHLAKDGRVISTRWEHLKRDQQASNHRAGNTQWQPVNYESEAPNAAIVNASAIIDGKPYADADGTPYEIFPEAFVHIENGINVEPNRDTNEPLHDFNEFLPWEITENGERHQTMNHVGRHEFGGVYQEGSKIDDPNLVFGLGNYSSNAYRETVGSDAGIFQIKEDPRPGKEGTFYGTWSREFKRFASGRIFEFSLPIGANPQDMEVVDWSSPDIDNVANAGKGHFRNPIMTMDGVMLVSHATEDALFDQSHPYTFRICKMVKNTADASDTEHIPGSYLTGAGLTKDIVYWGDSSDPITVTVQLSEVGIAEIVTKDAPVALPTYEVDPIEKSVLDEEAIDLEELRAWMIENNLAIIAIRNATERDQGESQQPFNLRVPGGVESIPSSGKVYDISHFQIFQADLIRGYGLRNYDGRRPIATPIHDTDQSPVIEKFNLLDPQAPEGSVKIGLDGSIAAFVPATRALSWQTLAPDGEEVVRERQWLTFSPGEIRTCEGCHGINNKTHLGNDKPINKPEALRDLVKAWKSKMDGTTLGLLSSALGNEITIEKIFPNPFSNETLIRFSLKESQLINVSIYNIQGKLVRELSNDVLKHGEHTLIWKGENDLGGRCTSGIYMCKLSTENGVHTSKIVLK
ncbi:MAG: T9SS type A sorting domain-containing protein [Ekhidna sp.]|uniref:T9SS type A sorting domain-containing protein n=1 Tax=Ekhidna sp. TaxID=2608089 RepID=UPI0032ED0EC5